MLEFLPSNPNKLLQWQTAAIFIQAFGALAALAVAFVVSFFQTRVSRKIAEQQAANAIDLMTRQETLASNRANAQAQDADARAVIQKQEADQRALEQNTWARELAEQQAAAAADVANRQADAAAALAAQQMSAADDRAARQSETAIELARSQHNKTLELSAEQHARTVDLMKAEWARADALRASTRRDDRECIEELFSDFLKSLDGFYRSACVVPERDSLGYPIATKDVQFLDTAYSDFLHQAEAAEKELKRVQSALLRSLRGTLASSRLEAAIKRGARPDYLQRIELSENHSLAKAWALELKDEFKRAINTL